MHVVRGSHHEDFSATGLGRRYLDLDVCPQRYTKISYIIIIIICIIVIIAVVIMVTIIGILCVRLYEAVLK